MVSIDNARKPSAYYTPFLDEETGTRRADFFEIKQHECELDRWIALFSFFNDASSSDDPVKVERLFSTAPTPGKRWLLPLSFHQLLKTPKND